MRIACVTPHDGNHFMTELLAAVAHELAEAGAQVAMAFDAFPPVEHTDAYVVVPHEYFACAPSAAHPTAGQLRRTIALCVEQPGTSWFELSYRHARRCGAAMDIERSAAAELRQRGLAAEHFQLGYSSLWDGWHRDEEQERPIDVLFLGSHTERRERLLASYGEALWDARAVLLVPPEAPKTEARADYLIEDAKRNQLRSSKTLLNLHRQDSPYIEWLRFIEAICNGCVVVSEHCADCAPLIPGEHFLSARPESLGLLARGLAGDAERVATMRLATYDYVRSELPMARSANRLLEIAGSLSPAAGWQIAPRFCAARLRARKQAVGERVRSATFGAATGMAVKAKELMLQDPELAHLFRGASELDFQMGKLRAAIKRVALDELVVQRLLERDIRQREGVDVTSLLEVVRTPEYGLVDPRVSVLVPLHNYATEVIDALGSVAASDYDGYELVVLDDASTDDSRAVVASFLESRPGLPARLVANSCNRGLGKVRNTLATLGRGEFAFFLDADNAIYPSALARLSEALQADAGALFAYGMIELRAGGIPTGLVSFRPWEPELLRDGNYIDAMALFRRRELLDIGGFDEDVRMTGWEDYDLWCRCASRGLRGVLVPQILTRYRDSDHSMLSLTSIDHQVSWSMLVNRYPRLLGGALIPWHMRTLHPAPHRG